jgi:hypothetical protein
MSGYAPPGGKLRHNLAAMFQRRAPDAAKLAQDIAADPRERARLESMKPATSENAAALAEAVKDELDRIPREPAPIRREPFRRGDEAYKARCRESALKRWSKESERKKQSVRAQRRSATPEGQATLDKARARSILARRSQS